ncbi:MAG TPA: type II toxin-antitoxin system VapC family toxin [Sedimentisphaerales bacterium]|jgi:tRNA(fMet)-specific endonuclease VapC|nr:type II toxin-antitoxin system VapC family toxin [Sedimentisphaerales bacterium]HNU29720.1 type II toxin-antitoxin system VapC family toxin [Sedimentisphaerales bacterium]
MNGRYLLDTNVIIALLAGEAGVGSGLATADEVFFPSTGIGELYYGARKSSRPSENLARIDELVLTNAVLACDSETARRYGEIKHALRIKGRPLPENDIWIAALARQYDLTLVTRDTHFEQIDNLNLIAW